MSLVDKCPICGSDFSSRYHKTAAWTVRTIVDETATDEGVKYSDSVHVNLRITCRDGRFSQVIVKGVMNIFHDDVGDA